LLDWPNSQREIKSLCALAARMLHIHYRGNGRSKFMLVPVILFVLTALGGLVLAAIRFSGQPRPPTALAVGHGLAALTSLAVLGYMAATTGVPMLANVALGVLGLAALGGRGHLCVVPPPWQVALHSPNHRSCLRRTHRSGAAGR
jgi:hypothetical protein